MADARLVVMRGDGFEREHVLDVLRRFVGVEPAAAAPRTVLSTVLFTDIVASTKKQAALGDHAWKKLVTRHHAIVREELRRWHGRENDTAGDGFYATFDGPARAIRCALAVVNRVRDLGIEVRAGVHTGECQLIEGKCAGLTVSIGARVAASAGPGEVVVSQTVKDLVAGSRFCFEDLGVLDLKGVPTGGACIASQNRGTSVSAPRMLGRERDSTIHVGALPAIVQTPAVKLRMGLPMQREKRRTVTCGNEFRETLHRPNRQTTTNSSGVQ
jgi:class 3 adenylate cyclase